ncbi:MAG: CoA transferase [Burkholderiaceae bacterium]|nr:CoA transferase [Burkholderiaceae bacterium]
MSVLKGIRVLEFEAIGPGPFCGMMLADMGADVIRVHREQPAADLGLAGRNEVDVLGRGRRSVTLDLKQDQAREAALELIGRADALIEGFRPGTMERLGLGPDAALARNPRLVYGRMTGWGQTGPIAHTAGHDIDYIALSGVLSAIGRPEGRPVPPLNLVGDFGGGGMMLALGIVAALLNVARGGQGQVIDAAMTEGAAVLGAGMWGALAAGRYREQRGVNVLDGGAPWYDTYETRDGGHVAVGAIEHRFYNALIAKLGLDPATLPEQHDFDRFPELRERIAAVFKTRTRDEWAAEFADSDGCVAPVLKFSEAPAHPQHQAREAFVTVSGVVQPGPAPRFLGTPSATPRPAPARGENGEAALHDWGFDATAINRMRANGLGATGLAHERPDA